MRWTSRLLVAAMLATTALTTMALPAQARSHSKYGILVSVSPAVSGTPSVTGDVPSFKGKVTGKTTNRTVYLQTRTPGHSYNKGVKVRTDSHGN